MPDSADRYNKILGQNVSPHGWENPNPATRYNLAVVGAGTAGLVTAAGAAALGAKVALVERNLMGGDCLNYGCVPSKAILRAARAIRNVRESDNYGISGTEAAVDFASVMERMRSIRARLSSHDSADRFSGLGVDVFFGDAIFAGRDSIIVGNSRILFRKGVICTGTRPAVPGIPGLEKIGYLTNETVFSLTSLPQRISIIGAGPIGCELAQAFARFGSRVTIIGHRSGQILPKEDAEAVEIVAGSLRRDGVELVLPAKILGAEFRCGEKVLIVEFRGEQRLVPADGILVAAGRIPNVDGMRLDLAEVSYDNEQGIKVDDHLRTSNRNLYAAGDVCSRFRFTHAADEMARMVIANALFLGKRRFSSLHIPWCTYTDPEVAHVGIYQRDAEARGIEITTLTVPMTDVDRAVVDGEDEGFVRIHLRKGSDAILGATVVAENAGEMITQLTIAMSNGLGLLSLGKTIRPYPTCGEAIKRVADLYNRTRLSPWLKAICDRWLRWQRNC